MSQSNTRFNALDTDRDGLSLTMAVGFGWNGIKENGRPLATMVQLKKNIVEMGAEENSLAHALIIGTAESEGRMIRPVVHQLF